jgi:hypothetical protein
MVGHPLGIYSVPPLGGEPRMLLDEAFASEPLPDGSLIVEKLTDQGDNHDEPAEQQVVFELLHQHPLTADRVEHLQQERP